MIGGLSRRQIETAIAALLALSTIVITVVRGENDALAGPKELKLKEIGSFNQPTFLAQPNDEHDLLFITEKGGTVRVVKDGDVEVQPFLDITNLVKSNRPEQGLLSIAFDPDYEDSGLFYVAYTNKFGDLRIVEYTRSDDELMAEPASAREVMLVRQNSDRHIGGLLLFGPDKSLYIGTGDGGPSYDPFNTSQNKEQLLGKLLRINPHKSDKDRYTIPQDNPFVGRPGRDEIYAYGLRNPWRFSFDRATGALAIGDVGQDRFEEVNLLRARQARGANFGWSAYEAYGTFKGSVPKKNTIKPALAYPHEKGACSVTGGYFVRDPGLAGIEGRELTGRYLFGDYCTGRIRAVRPKIGDGGAGRDRGFGLPKVELLTSFGEDRDGHIYVLSQTGPVYRLEAG